jgi:hypothetical protein
VSEERGVAMGQPSDPGSDPKACSICGDSEPSHVHHEGRRIEDYFTVGRGETEMEAARRWKARALAAERSAVPIATVSEESKDDDGA